MTKAPISTENSKEESDNVNKTKASKNCDNATIADRLSTASRSNDSHPAGKVKPVYEI